MDAPECDKQEEDSRLERWLPPRKKLALQPSDGDPNGLPSPINESMTVVTSPKVLLRHHQPELAQHINLESLVPYLNQQQLLTDAENEVVLNLYLTQRMRVLKLLQFLETKGEIGFQGFLKAIADEPQHLGHGYISKLLAPYRCDIPNKHEQTPMQSVVNDVALHAALQPIRGVEFDLEETFIQCPRQAQVPTSNTADSEKSDTIPSASTSSEPSKTFDTDTELQEIRDVLENDHPDVSCTKVVRKYPNLIFPAGPLKKQSSSFIYNSLFKMAWGGNEDKARSLMKHFRHDHKTPIDIKIISMEVVHTVNAERDLKVLTSALAFTDRPACENKSILKCRLHRRIAGLHYRNDDLEEANEHMDTALQLAHNIGPDIDTIYTMRLKALMLFEDYKRTKNAETYRNANKFFTRAMDHARQQPESKRIITERVKVSKALFHLDMREEYRKQEEGQNTLMELECRAQETLEDVGEEYLTEGDKAFLYMTRARLFVCSQDWQEARSEAQKALDINQRCGFDKRAREATELLAQLPSASS